MSDKNLTELEWKKFSKGKGFKDAALVKALAALEKAKAPDVQLEALAEIEKQADALRKGNKADKELGAYLDGLDKALDKDRKLADFEARKAAKAAESGGDEEEETPALLTTKMVPLLRQVRKGESMHVMLGVVGKEVGVLISRRPIAPTRRKLISDYVDAGTLKFFPGTCVFEENAYTFVMKTQAAGLAKKVKAALLKQVELRLKVRVRGEDPSDIDDDGDPAEEEEGTQLADAPRAGVIPPAPGLAPTPAAARERETPAAETPVADPLKTTFESRMAAIEPRVMAALRDQSGDVSKIRAVAAFVREKGDTGQYKAALAGMDSLAKLLENTNGVPAAPPLVASEAKSPAAAVPSQEAVAFNARLAALMPAVKAAIASGGEHAQDIKLKVSEAGVYARKQSFDQANGLLDDAEKWLDDRHSAVPDAPPTAPDNVAPKPAPAAADGETTAFNKRLAALLPGVKAATGEQAAEFKRRVTEAGALARSKDFGKANEVLDDLEAALKTVGQTDADADAGKPDVSVPTENTDTTAAEEEAAGENGEGEQTGDAASDDTARRQLGARLAALEDRYLALLAQNPADADKLRAVHGFASEQAEAGHVAKAVAALDRLDGMMAAAAATLVANGGSANAGTGYAGLVKYRKSLLDFRAAAAKVQGQIDGLKKAIPGALPGEAALADELADALSEFTGELLGAVDDAMNVAENEASPVTSAVAAQLRNYLREVSTNPLVKHVDSNPFGVSMRVEQTLTAALEDIRDAMPALA